MTAYSRHYEGLESPIIPSFDHYFFSNPTIHPDLVHHALPYLTGNVIDYPKDEFNKLAEKMLNETTLVNFGFSSQHIDNIWCITKEKAASFVSRMDAFSAYVCTLIQRVSVQPIEDIQLVLSVRLVGRILYKAGLLTIYHLDQMFPPGAEQQL